MNQSISPVLKSIALILAATALTLDSKGLMLASQMSALSTVYLLSGKSPPSRIHYACATTSLVTSLALQWIGAAG